MNIKKKLAAGVLSSALGLSLVAGGTFAYFSDQETAESFFAAGTLDLEINKENIIKIDNLKPGDYAFRAFELKNAGSLNIKDILLQSEYEVYDKKGDNNGEDFGEHIIVQYLYNVSGKEQVIFTESLANLTNNPVQVLENMPAGARNATKFTVQFKFIDNGQDQNIYQGDALELKWTFKANQEAGSSR
ncbi:TasA family protein [Bacillus mesophilum]|uniref:Cell division protein FtsN n=1 Tax=Bacillus mesophilum TaxID=1071718 RepID=A0A7V7RKQ0_9BACI|nr:TasA family protein [Bacillus mesophilum]KAB2331921.1 cell division protein FtsN [Bacillus mesophilum]